MLDGHTGWSSRSLIANLVVTQAVALAGHHPATLVVVLVVALAEQHSGLSLLWLIRTLASTLTCRRTRSPSHSLIATLTGL